MLTGFVLCRSLLAGMYSLIAALFCQIIIQEADALEAHCTFCYSRVLTHSFPLNSPHRAGFYVRILYHIRIIVDALVAIH